MILLHYAFMYNMPRRGGNLNATMQNKISIAILECNQGVIDGYLYRLQFFSKISIVTSTIYADDLDDQVIQNLDVLITGINVQTPSNSHNQLPVFFYLKKIRMINPKIKVIIIGDYIDQQLVINYFQAGIDGIISRNDQQAIIRLGEIVELIFKGGVYLSGEFRSNDILQEPKGRLTLRQLEILSLCAAYPDEASTNLAKKLNISSSTFRNQLSNIYEKLDVRTRAGAILKAEHLGLIQSSRPAKGEGQANYSITNQISM